MAIAVREAEDVDRPSTHHEICTRRCHEHGHREFALRFDSRRTASADVEALAQSLEHAVANGSRFAPGDVVHVGWVPLRVVAAPSKMLSLVEPDFCGAPLRYVSGVDASLGHLRAQDDFANRVGLGEGITRPALTDHVRVCSHLTSRGLVLDRGPRGWIVACGEPAENDHALNDATLYDLVCRFPHLVDFLALPVGTTVACTDVGDAIVWQDGREVGVRTGMSIAARMSRITRTAPLARCGSIR